MIVVDVNVVAFLLITGSKTELARRVRTHDSEWRLPFLWRAEFLNILWMQVRHSGVPIEIAERYWEVAMRLMKRGEVDVDPIHVLRMATENSITTYDAQYVSLASKLRVPCVSEDRELQLKFEGSVISMARFVSQFRS